MAIFAGYQPPQPPPPPPDTPTPSSVEAKRRTPAMRTQSLSFDRSKGWTPEKAKAWAKSHGFKTNKVDVTDQHVRLRQLDPEGSSVKRTVPFGKGIRAVVAREENMKTKKTKSRRPAATAKRKSAKKPKAAARRTPSKAKAKKSARVVTARRRPRHARETRVTNEARRPKKRKSPKSHKAREATKIVAEARRPKKRKSPRSRKGPSSYVMAKRPSRARKPRKSPKARAWFGDSAGHSKAAKKGWRTRKSGRSTKGKTATEARRPKKHRVRETAPRVAEARRPKKHRVRASTRVAESRRPKKRVVRAPNYRALARTAGQMALELGSSFLGYLLADGLDRFLATYNPTDAKKPDNKFTSDGNGMLANALNVASPPHLWRWGSLGLMTALPLGSSLFVKNAAARSVVEGIGLGAGIKLASTVWSSVLMPMLIGKDTSTPALQKNVIARLYPAETSAVLNIKSGKAAVSSGGANSTAGGA